MPVLFTQKLDKHDLLRRIGQLSQVAGIRMMELRDGREAGVRIADVRTGSGLRYQVSLDRGMDISVAEFKGIPLAWRSVAGDVHPSYYDPKGLGWSRSFPGGLMTGCGISHLGAPCVDEEEELGLHGRLSHLPAHDVRAAENWESDMCTLTLEGFVREWGLFKENLLLQRKIESRVGESTILLRDTVRNEANQRSPLMMLYHINAGWPLVDEGTRLMVRESGLHPRDAEAEKGVLTARVLSSPVKDYKEQVFYHDLLPDDDGFAVVGLVNRKLQLALTVRYRQKELPKFIQWKMMGEGTYVMGMEPANCGVAGRAKERERGTLQFLEPEEEREFQVEIGVVEGKQTIDHFIHTHHLT